MTVLKQKDLDVLKSRIPLNTLTPERFSEVLSGIEAEEYSTGQQIFSLGDDVKEFIYLISGEIGLYAGARQLELISSDSDVSRFAIAHQIPRKVKGLANQPTRIIRLATNLLDEGRKDDLSAGYLVEESVDETGDWMTTMLQSPIFQKLPAANLQKVMMQMEAVTFEPGGIVVKQGDIADYYYIIENGDCDIIRQPSENARPIKLAELHSCDSFGEDALLSGAPRNVTVQMQGKGQLLRLSKENFIKLVKEPVLQYVDYKQASQKIEEGAAWLDVRGAEDFEKNHLDGSVNIPFFSLRMKVSSIRHDQQQILVCGDGRTSEAAAFLLLRFGFNALILKKGINGVTVKAPAQEKVEPTVAKQADLSRPAASENKGDQGQQLKAAQEFNELEQRYNQSEEKLEELATEVDGLRQGKSQYESELAGKQQTVDSLQQQLEVLEKGQHSTDQEAAMLQQQLKESAEENARLALQLQETEGKEASFSDSIEAKQSLLDQLQLEKAEALGRLETSEGEQSKQVLEQAGLRQELESLQGLIKSLRADKEAQELSSSTDFKRLTEELELSQRDKSEVEQDYQKLTSELDKATSAKAEINAEREKFQESADSSSAELEQLRKEKAEVAEELAQLNKKHLKLEENLAEASGEAVSQLERLKQLDDEAESARNHLNESDAKALNLAKELTESEAKIQQQQELEYALRKDHVQQLAAYDLEKKALSKELAELLGEKEAQEKITEQFTREAELLEESALDGQEELRQSQSELKQAQSLLSEKDVYSESLHARLQEMEASMLEASDEKSSLKQKLESADKEAAELTTLQQEYVGLKNDFAQQAEQQERLAEELIASESNKVSAEESAEHLAASLLEKNTELEDVLAKLGSSQESNQLAKDEQELLENKLALLSKEQQTVADELEVANREVSQLAELKHEVVASQADFEQQVAENKELLETIEGMKVFNVSQENSASELSSLLLEKDSDIAALQVNLDSSQESAQLAKSEKEQLENKLALSSQESQKLVTELEIANKEVGQFANLQQEHAELQGNYELQASENKQLLEAVEGMKASGVAVEKTADDLSSLLKSKEVEAAALLAKLERLEEQAEAAATEKEKLESKLSLTEQELAVSSGGQQEISNELELAHKKAAEHSELKQNHIGLKNDFEQLTAEKKGLLESVANLELEVGSAKQALEDSDSLLSEKTKAEKELSEQKQLRFETDVSNVKKQLSATEQELALVTEASQVSLLRVAELEGSIANKDTELDKLHSDALSSDSERAGELEKVRAEMLALEVACQALENDREGLGRSLASAEKEVLELRLGVEKAESGAEPLNQKIDELKRQLEKNDMDFLALTAENEELDKENAVLSSKVALDSDSKKEAGQELIKAQNELSESAQARLIEAEKEKSLNQELQALTLSMASLSQNKEALDADLMKEREGLAVAQEEAAKLKSKLGLAEQEAASLKIDVKSLEQKLGNQSDAEHLMKELDKANARLLDIEIQEGTVETIVELKAQEKEAALSEELSSTKSELQLVREQTEVDVLALKSELEKIKRVNIALQKKLQALHAASSPSQVEVAPSKKAVKEKKGWWK